MGETSANCGAVAHYISVASVSDESLQFGFKAGQSFFSIKGFAVAKKSKDNIRLQPFQPLVIGLKMALCI
jgi:hypothetical protein